jgi:hypothetical protein
MNSKYQKRNERLRSNMREFGHERISSLLLPNFAVKVGHA